MEYTDWLTNEEKTNQDDDRESGLLSNVGNIIPTQSHHYLDNGRADCSITFIGNPPISESGLFYDDVHIQGDRRVPRDYC